jgi:lysophospholipase L1-like esterase
MALRTVGGAPYFTPQEVLDRVAQCVRAILTREAVTVIVRGPINAHGSDAGGRIAARARARWYVVDHGLRELCQRLHVDYLGFPGPADAGPDSPTLQGDFVHLNRAGHRERAEHEAAAMIAAWRHAGGGAR